MVSPTDGCRRCQQEPSLTIQYFTQPPNGDLEQTTSDHFDKVAYDELISYVLTSGTGTSANLEKDDLNSTDSEIIFKSSETILTADINRIFYSYKIGQAKFQFAFE